MSKNINGRRIKVDELEALSLPGRYEALGSEQARRRAAYMEKKDGERGRMAFANGNDQQLLASTGDKTLTHKIGRQTRPAA